VNTQDDMPEPQWKPEMVETKPGGKADDDGGKRGPSQASLLVKLARERYELFMSEDGRPYGVVRNGANIALPLRGRAGLRSQLAKVFTDESGGTVPTASALADAMTVLEGVAAEAEPRIPHLRVAEHEDGIVVDLASSNGQCVIVTPAGWIRAARSPVLFRRSGAMKPLPVPTSDGDGLAKLRALVNTDDEGYRLNEVSRGSRFPTTNVSVLIDVERPWRSVIIAGL
jgi:hypothetical protein